MNKTNKPSKRKLFREGILTMNPVVVGAFGLFPIVSAGTSLKQGVVISLLILITMPIVSGMTSLFGKLMPKWLRAAFYVIAASLILIPLTILLRAALDIPNNFLDLFIPLISVNAIISYRAEKFAVTHSLKRSLLDALANGLGFTLVMLLVSVVREVLGSSTLWDVPILWGKRIDGLLLPLGGFIILGFMAALLKHIISKTSEKEAGQND